MSDETTTGGSRMPRRGFLARGALGVGAAASLSLTGTERALAHPGGGVAKGTLGLVGLDHVGITVPDLGQAVEWFEDVLGAAAPLTFGPFEGAFLEGALDVVPGTRIDRITELRIGRGANIELFQYAAP